MKRTFFQKKLFGSFFLIFCFAICSFGQVVIERKNSSKENDQTQVSKEKKNVSIVAKSSINTLQIEQDILEILNKKRAEQKLKPLVWNDRIAKISRGHSKAMAEEKFFSLKSKDGKSVKDQAYDAEIINWTNFGRMIASGTEVNEIAKTTVDRWFSSEPRRRYLLNSIWQQTGVGVFVDKEGKIYITQDFLGK